MSGILSGVVSYEDKIWSPCWCENHHLAHCIPYLHQWKLNHWQVFAYGLRFFSNKAPISKKLSFKSSKEDYLYNDFLYNSIKFFLSYFNEISYKVFIGTRSCRLKIGHKSILIQIVQMKQESIQGSAFDCFCSIKS